MNVASEINQECTQEWLTIETGSTRKQASETCSGLSFVGYVQLFLWHILLCGYPINSCWLSLWSCVKCQQAWSSLGLEIGLAYSHTGTDFIHVTAVVQEVIYQRDNCLHAYMQYTDPFSLWPNALSPTFIPRQSTWDQTIIYQHPREVVTKTWPAHFLCAPKAPSVYTPATVQPLTPKLLCFWILLEIFPASFQGAYSNEEWKMA